VTAVVQAVSDWSSIDDQIAGSTVIGKLRNQHDPAKVDALLDRAAKNATAFLPALPSFATAEEFVTRLVEAES
ncbi:hypothetical protein, partial [Serratia marcescens]|uniref:hypothetical protein n=1 Tax=Serratia marcescens TaxID=615 RepID=UPI0013DB9F38